MIDFCEFSSLFLKSPSDVTSINMYVTLMITINQVQVWMNYDVQKQLSRGVLSKRCSENMQKIYRRTFIPNAIHILKITNSLYHLIFSRTQNCNSMKTICLSLSNFYKRVVGIILKAKLSSDCLN